MHYASFRKEAKKHGIVDYPLKSQFEVSYGTIYAPYIIHSYDRNGVSAFQRLIEKQLKTPLITLIGMSCMEALILEWEACYMRSSIPHLEHSIVFPYKQVLIIKIGY